MRGHYYTTDPKDASRHIANDGLVLEEVACYIYKYDQTQPLPAGTAKLYQLYDRIADFRFYTPSEEEALQLLSNPQQYTEEAVLGLVYWPQQPVGIATTQFYRLRNTSTNEHLYTTASGEKDVLSGHGWVEENLHVGAGFVFTPGQAPEEAIPVYRLLKQ